MQLLIYRGIVDRRAARSRYGRKSGYLAASLFPAARRYGAIGSLAPTSFQSKSRARFQTELSRGEM